ncbi:MAG: hypothetical protein H3C38_09155 [Rhodospirillales bacterium]|nr:hypothetical protein [Rhodospirillales bacterium]
MPTEIQITNRNPLTTKRVTAKLQDEDLDDPFMEFVISPGEAVIIPIKNGMTLLVSEETAAREGAEAETV